MKPLHIPILLLSLLLITSCQKEKAPVAVTPSELQVQLAYAIKSQLGEGPIWDAASQQLYWVDIQRQAFYIFDPSKRQNKSYDMPSPIGTVVPHTDSSVVVALEDGIYTLNLSRGNLQRFCDVEADKPINRFNDGKCDPAGRLWVGSMHYEQSAPEAALYMVRPDGTYELKVDSVTISNGIVWTKDKKTMYYIDTPTGHIRAYDYDNVTGAITNERIAINVPDTLGFPDGMTIDENDQLWVGLWNGNGVAHFNPKTGALIQKIEIPAHNVTACAFGGAKLDTLYITSSSLDMTDEEKAKYPLAGSLFKVNVGVKGVESVPFGL